MRPDNKKIFNFDNSYARLPSVFFTRMRPLPVCAPEAIILNQTLAAELGVDFSPISPGNLAKLFCGNVPMQGAEPLAQAYAGHQYGRFTMLGDGRALLLGEHITQQGGRFDLQFKGSGPTPYSRGGDGRAALEPMLREYIISEAMYRLGIPTTRSLAVVATGEPVYREAPLPGAMLTRVAASHIRIGTFEYAAILRDQSLLQTLVNYTVNRHYPDSRESENKALALLNAVIARQVNLIVEWMRVGFIHGVMNTDNMSLCGETIDYGPCAFIDEYDPAAVFSSIDRNGRYAYGNQTKIAQWNLARFAETLLPLLHRDKNRAIETAETAVNRFGDLYQDKWLAMMRAKLGFFGKQSGDEKLIADLLQWMHKHQADYTNTFFDLMSDDILYNRRYTDAFFQDWFARRQIRLAQNNKSTEAVASLMQVNNPAVIPRNHQVERVLQATSHGDFNPLHKLIDVLERPYTDRSELKPYQTPPSPVERVTQTFCGT